ncbi:phage tail protein [Pseudomonas nicosulfuronedens]
MSLSAQIFGRDSGIFKFNNIMLGGGPGIIDSLYRKLFPEAKTPSPTIPTVQDSAYGNQIPRFYGMVGTSGNVIWLKGGKLDVTVKKKKSGGKGGSSSSATTTYSFFATFALSLGEGPIAGVRRIWCGDKLIYNAGSDDLETIIAGNRAAKGWKLYLGTDDQLPDPDIQADKGVDNTPAYRGLAYIKFKKFALKDYGDSLAGSQFKVEIVATSTTVGLRRVEAQTNRQDSYTVAHVKSVNGYFRVSQRAGATDNTYNLDGERTGVTPAQFPIIPNPDTRYYVGYIDGDMVSVIPSLVDIASGAITRANDVSNSFIANLPPTDRLYGCALNTSMTALLVITGPAGGSGDKWFLIDHGGTILSNGTTSTPIDDSAIGFGNVASYLYASAVLEDDLTHLWVAYGAGEGDVWVYSMEGGILHSVGRLSQGAGLVDWNFSKVSIMADSGFAVAFYDDNMCSFVRTDVVSLDPPTLASVIQSECSYSNLISPSDIDVSLMTGAVTGYKIVGGSIRDAIEPLRSAYMFDVRMHGYKLQFLPRGQASGGTIPWGDLAATDGEEIGDSLPYDREMDTQLPAKVSVKGISATREYADSTQTYERIGTFAVNTQTVDLGLVLSDDELSQIAEKICELAWQERQVFSFTLPPTYQDIEPGDIRTINAKFGTFELRFTEVSTGANGILECKATLNHAALYASNAAGAPAPGPDGEISLDGPSLWVPMDIPIVDETIQNTPGTGTAMTGYTEGWPGAVLVSSPDGGQTYSDIQAYVGRSTIGTCKTSLTENSGALVDQSTLQLNLMNGEISSITLEQMITGANYAAYGNDRRWEIVRFQNAALQSDGSYLVSGFVRGDKGTEWATGTHLVGDYFIPLDDPDNIFIGLPVESIGLERLYRAVTSGDDLDSASDQPFTYRGVNLKPLSGVYPQGVRNGSGDLTAAWTRRSRLSSTWWWTGIPAPIGETSESYEVDVMSGSTVKRTISSTTPSIIYTAAQQTTDFGSLQSSITLRIYQLSTTVGRGYPLEVTL